MTLDAVKTILEERDISFELLEFQNEAEYWHHTALFPDTKNAKPCKVIAIIIRSNNGTKNMELQFNLCDDVYQFEDLYFGEYTYELFGTLERVLEHELIDYISRIMNGSEKIIVVNDLKKNRWLGDMCFGITDDDLFGLPGYRKALKKIQKPKGFLERLVGTKRQYEIYDWDSYVCIVK